MDVQIIGLDLFLFLLATLFILATLFVEFLYKLLGKAFGRWRTWFHVLVALMIICYSVYFIDESTDEIIQDGFDAVNESSHLLKTKIERQGLVIYDQTKYNPELFSTEYLNKSKLGKCIITQSSGMYSTTFRNISHKRQSEIFIRCMDKFNDDEGIRTSGFIRYGLINEEELHRALIFQAFFDMVPFESGLYITLNTEFSSVDQTLSNYRMWMFLLILGYSFSVSALVYFLLRKNE